MKGTLVKIYSFSEKERIIHEATRNITNLRSLIRDVSCGFVDIFSPQNKP